MWLPKWLHKRTAQQPTQVSTPVEYTTHVVQCGPFEHQQGDGSKVVLVIHLPSRRVSEKHYDSTGTLTSYIQNSPMAESHIEHLCSQDGRLRSTIKEAGRIERQHKREAHRYVIIRKGALACLNLTLASVLLYILWILGVLLLNT